MGDLLAGILELQWTSSNMLGSCSYGCSRYKSNPHKADDLVTASAGHYL